MKRDLNAKRVHVGHATITEDDFVIVDGQDIYFKGAYSNKELHALLSDVFNIALEMGISIEKKRMAILLGVDE